MRKALYSLLASTTLAWGAAPPPPSAPQPSEGALRAHLAFLADDLLEGRGTGQRGGELAVRYLETQLQALGLRPACGDSYRQKVTLTGARLDPAASHLSFRGPRGVLTPELGTALVCGPGGGEAALEVSAPLVFVGHGVFSGDGERDDYKGMDVRGKVLVMLTGDRPENQGGPLCCQRSNYYGRWTYKFEEGQRRGAAGVLLIHTTPSAGYGWNVVRNGWTGERFQEDGSGAPGTLHGWLSQEGAREVFKAAGQDLDRLILKAQGQDFRPVPLDLKVEGALRAQVRHLEQWNVAGVLPGTDPRLKDEAVLFSAHWDHFGRGSEPGAPSFNGAIDNASGCAGALAIAQALSGAPLKRSVLFLFPCGEEQGLLGSGAYVRSPLWPLSRTVLDINLESLNFVGPTRDIGLLGPINARVQEQCERAARSLGLRITPAKADPSGLCFRSDHFPFAKAGVQALSPGFSLDGGWDYLGDRGAAQAKAQAYLERYHRPSDRFDPAWDLRGMMQQVAFCLELGRLAGNE